MNLQQLINTLLGAAPEVGKGLVRGVTADVVGAPVDTLNAVRQGLLMPAQAGNPAAREIVGLLGPVQQAGTSDYFAQQMGLPAGQGMAYEAGRMLSPSPADIVSAFRRAPSIQELITYHGTPHKFPATEANPLGEFDASKIGAGTGRQAFGHGIYLAEAPGTAKEYAARGGGFRLVDTATNKEISPGEAAKIAYDLPEIEANRWDRTWGDLDSFTQRQVAAKFASASKGRIEEKPVGSLYTSDLPDEMIDRMLDWDKPLNEQPKAVREIIDRIENEFSIPKQPYKNQEPTGFWYGALSEAVGGQKNASKLLKEYGVPGIKYLDQGGRSEGKETRNFVVFPGEEKKVKILKRE